MSTTHRGKCVYCGVVGQVGFDHVIPKSRGGPDVAMNRVSACFPCNLRKSDRLPSEWSECLNEDILGLQSDLMKSYAVLDRGNRAAARMTETQKLRDRLMAGEEGLIDPTAPITSLRILAGLTQSEAAKALGVSPPTQCQSEARGAGVRLSSIVAAAEKLGYEVTVSVKEIDK